MLIKKHPAKLRGAKLFRNAAKSMLSPPSLPEGMSHNQPTTFFSQMLSRGTSKYKPIPYLRTLLLSIPLVQRYLFL
jgi:hypothetical protein